MDATNLRIPGPTPLPPAVLRAMQREMIPHRGPVFRSFFRHLLQQVQRIHQTEGDVVILPGSGSAGWEAAIVNTLSPGDTVLVFVTGDFGERWARVAERLRLNVVRVSVPWGQAATPEVVAPALEAHPTARAVLYTYNETATGVTNPLPAIAPLVRDHGALLLVDGVSAVGGIPVEMDAWGIDLILSGSQKAWMCPPGLVIMGIGPRVWEAYERADYPRFFWDLREARDAAKTGNTPTTAPLTLLYALQAACDILETEGLDSVYARHQHLAQVVRTGLEALDYRLYAAEGYRSNTVTAAIPPEGVAVPEVVKRLRTGFGIEIADGQGPIKDRVIRVGHMGWVHEPELERTLAALRVVTEALRRA